MLVLVSGGGGFFGNVLCRDLLKRGYKVRCVDNFHKGNCDAIIGLIDKPGFEFMYGDVSNRDDVAKMMVGVDATMHLAALVGFPACARQPALAWAVNEQGTKNIVDLSGSNPVISASTGSVYGTIPDVCNEDSPLNPLTVYGETKKAAEQYVTEFCENGVSFRFATGFGVSPNMRVNLLVNTLVYNAVTENSLNVFQPDFRRTFISVKDMSRAFIFGLENIDSLKYKVYNAGANHLNWTKRELANCISEKTGAFVSFNEAGVDLDQRDYEVCYDRLTDEGFKCVVSMEQGIDELIKVSKILRIRHQYE